MFNWQPGKWIQYAGLVVLPFAGASFITTGDLQKDISSSAVKAAGGDWAKVQLDGRDITVSGTAPNEASKAAALAAIGSAYGVRVANTDGITVAPPPAPKAAEVVKAEEVPKVEAPKVEVPAVEVPKVEPLAVPTVDSVVANINGSTISGTWSEGKAKTLDVIVNDIDYSFGKSAELTSTAGNWVLKLAAGVLPVGTFAVMAKVGDGDKETVMAAPDKIPQLIVAAPEPPPAPLIAPTVTSTKADNTGTVVTGTWDEGKAKGLDVTVDGKTYSLGDAKELSSEKGVWTLTAPALGSGSHEITAKESNGTQSTGAAAPTTLNVEAPPPPPPPPPPPEAATVANVTSTTDRPTITGTFPAGNDTKYQVELGGVTHTLGTDSDLTTDTAGKWTLVPAQPLANGAYDLVMKVTGADGQVTSTVAKGAVVVNVTPPPPPPATVANVASAGDRPTLTGTFPAGNGTKYQVELDGVTHTLGTDPDLTTDTSGKWTLVPAKPLVNGSFDVIMKVTGADGQVTNSVAKGAVVVNVPPPPPPPPPEKPYDCVAALGITSASFPIRFEFDHADLGANYIQSLNNYAKILIDARCAATKLKVTGFADYLGSDEYNIALSGRRAETVVGLLGKAGVDVSRLTTFAAGKTQPLDPANSADARAKNRRAEFTVQ